MPTPPPQPPHEPTEESRKQARALSGYGVRQEVICHALGVSLPTLHKYYRKELDEGNAAAQGQIAKSAFDRAVHDKDTSMIIWLTKTRLHWKDTSRVVVAGDEDGPPVKLNITHHIVGAKGE